MDYNPILAAVLILCVILSWAYRTDVIMRFVGIGATIGLFILLFLPFPQKDSCDMPTGYISVNPLYLYNQEYHNSPILVDEIGIGPAISTGSLDRLSNLGCDELKSQLLFHLLAGNIVVEVQQ